MSYEAVQMINACTHANIPVKQDGDKVNMCQAIIDLKKEAYDNGFQKGEESGILQSSSRIAIKMYRSKYDMQEIVRMTGLTSEAIEKLVKAQPEERK